MKQIKDEIFVEKNELNKLLTIAEIMENYEVRVLSFSKNNLKKDDQTIIDYFYIEDDQRVSNSNVDGNDHNLEKIIKIIENLRKDGSVDLGSAHSHGNFGVFYSGTDRNRFEQERRFFQGQLFENYLEFDLNKTSKNNNEGIISGFNGVDLEVLIDGNYNGSLEELSKLMKARILINRWKEISGITVNRRGEIYGIKRISYNLSSFGQDLDLSNLKKDDVDRKSSRLVFSLDSKVIPVDGLTSNKLDKDAILKELKQKVSFSGSKPSSFNEKIFVKNKPEFDKKENKKIQQKIVENKEIKLSDLFIEYVRLEGKYSKVVSQTLSEINNGKYKSFLESFVSNYESEETDKKEINNTNLLKSLKYDFQEYKSTRKLIYRIKSTRLKPSKERLDNLLSSYLTEAKTEYDSKFKSHKTEDEHEEEIERIFDKDKNNLENKVNEKAQKCKKEIFYSESNYDSYFKKCREAIGNYEIIYNIQKEIESDLENKNFIEANKKELSSLSEQLKKYLKFNRDIFKRKCDASFEELMNEDITIFDLKNRSYMNKISLLINKYEILEEFDKVDEIRNKIRLGGEYVS
ncbi:hypothetical protein KY334_08020 [Candidatus Woesearchaeota archaeon]|nr:hypothetical protein [Candidatus Woesearchaeota archaeon]